jgi:hypothetical protein
MRSFIAAVCALAVVTIVLLLGACGAPEPPPHRETVDTVVAAVALQASKFDEAARTSAAMLRDDPRSSRAAAVHAISTYRAAAHDLVDAIERVLAQGAGFKAIDHEGARVAWLTFLGKLEEVDRDLAIVAADPSFSLELCIACWEYDWNRSGRIDELDRKMLEIELDGKGGELAEGDPRRRPTYRFDVGDAEWARAMIAFQRAAVELVVAYAWSDLDNLFRDGRGPIKIRIGSKDRVRNAHRLILAGLAASDRCRRAYLAETDDDREWVPNPTQRSYAMPLEVDARLYETWEEVIGDVRRMLESKEGVSLREVATLLGESVSDLPNIYVDVGAMLRDPRDIVLDFRSKNFDTIARGVLGAGYKKSMKPSPLVPRLARMKTELSRGEDTFERKLRYLLWLN